jgi:ribonucleotide reductase beta subunit family protein with ferritin-like domain
MSFDPSTYDEDDRIVTIWDADRALRDAKRRKESVHPDIWPLLWSPLEATRETLLPILHPDIWGIYKTIERSHWVAEENDMSQDAPMWRKMSDADKHAIAPWLGFFSVADNRLISLIDLLKRYVNSMESQAVYAVQAAQEFVHVEAYQEQIRGLGMHPKDVDRMNKMFLESPQVAQLVEWIEGAASPSTSVASLVVNSAFAEGVVFKGAFTILRWFRERNLLPGVTTYNSWIARDEDNHAMHSTKLTKSHCQPWARLSQRDADDIARSAVASSAKLVSYTLPAPILDMNSDLMTQHVQFEADKLMVDMGYAPCFNVTSPFSFSEKELLNTENKANFFERKSSEYQGLGAGALTVKFNRSEPVA